MSQPGIDKLLGRDMPEIAYLKGTDVASVLSKALAETYKVRPNDPKTYFAKWLLNYSNEQKTAHLVSFKFAFQFNRKRYRLINAKHTLSP